MTQRSSLVRCWFGRVGLSGWNDLTNPESLFPIHVANGVIATSFSEISEQATQRDCLSGVPTMLEGVLISLWGAWRRSAVHSASRSWLHNVWPCIKPTQVRRHVAERPQQDGIRKITLRWIARSTECDRAHVTVHPRQCFGAHDRGAGAGALNAIPRCGAVVAHHKWKGGVVRYVGHASH
jgi:hypothetical protein